MLLGLKYFEKKCFIIFTRKKGLILLLRHAAFENGHTQGSIDLTINNSMYVSKLHIIRQKTDCAFGWHTIYLLNAITTGGGGAQSARGADYLMQCCQFERYRAQTW